MKENAAADYLNKGSKLPEDILNTCLMAIQKRIPMAIEDSIIKDYLIFRCGSCGETLFALNLETNQSCKIKGNYCPKCGQKADFSILEQAKEGGKQNEKQ